MGKFKHGLVINKMKIYCYEKTMIINGGKLGYKATDMEWSLKEEYIVFACMCINRISGRMCRCSIGF